MATRQSRGVLGPRDRAGMAAMEGLEPACSLGTRDPSHEDCKLYEVFLQWAFTMDFTKEMFFLP